MLKGKRKVITVKVVLKHTVFEQSTTAKSNTFSGVTATAAVKKINHYKAIASNTNDNLGRLKRMNMICLFNM